MLKHFSFSSFTDYQVCHWVISDYSEIQRVTNFYWIIIDKIHKIFFAYFSLLAFLIEYTVEGMLFVDRRVRSMRPQGGQRSHASESVLAGELW